MLKYRLIPVIIFKKELVVQSFFFKRHLPIGNVKTAIEYFANWDADEIILLDIDATKDKRLPNTEIIKWASKNCFIPITYGGGINSMKAIENVLKAGADKISINYIAQKNPNLIKEASKKFGSQCIVVSIDVKINNNGKYEVFTSNNKKTINLHPKKWAQTVEKLGAGEILLNSVDRDGSRMGYDIKLLKNISKSVNIPVIATGGVGKVEHLAEGILKGCCQAVGASNIFQHAEHSIILAKTYLKKKKIPIRLNSELNYDNYSFDHLGRPV